MLGESSRTLIIRYGTAILIIGLEGLALISGKLIKDLSLIAYQFYYHFACGILLAKSFSWFNSLNFLQLNSLNNQSINKENDIMTSFYFFSFSFLIFYGISLSNSTTISNIDHSNNSSYNYTQVIETPPEDDNIEMQNLSIHSDDDLSFEEVNGVVKASYSSPSKSITPVVSPLSGFSEEDFNRLEEENESKLPCLLRLGFYSMMLIEFNKGFLIGLEESQSYSVILYILFHGILIAISFGILCEEYIKSSSLYNKFLISFLLSYPSGLILANLSPFDLNFLYFIFNNLYCALTGLIMVTSFIYMLPLNKSLNQLIEVEINSTNSFLHKNLNKFTLNNLQNNINISSILKVSAFFVGYLLVLSL